MTDAALLAIVLTVAAVNVSILGLCVRVMMNGKPRKANNPRALDPDDTRLGDVSLAYFKEQFVAPIIEAIRENRG